jgi:hypothetical protein
MFPRRHTCSYCLVLAILVGVSGAGTAQSPSGSDKDTHPQSLQSLERDFFDALRAGNSSKILSYVPEGGVNVGSQAQHTSRDDIQQQFQSHQGLYCKLFDSSCINTPIDLENSAPSCSYRELLTHSKRVRTAGSEITRNGVQQAVLVAQVENSQCPKDKLIDFIFNLHAGGWKLFSVP